MLAWERQPGESEKSYAAFSLYRDLGPERSLRAVSETLYGVRWRYGKRTVEKWSSQHDWVNRIKALEARDEMVRREAVESHMRTKAHDFAERQARLMEGMLEGAEKAQAQLMEMLGWPLVEQRVLREGEGGEDVTILVMPARWSKGTAKTMFDIMGAAATGRWTVGTEEAESDLEWDFSNLSLEDQREWLRLNDMIGFKKKGE